MSEAADLIATRVLPEWPAFTGATVAPFGAGLINQTFLATAGGARAVLQRVSPIFSSLIHENIAAVTRRLRDAGLTTPSLLPTRDGRLFVELPDAGVWRLMTFVEGVSFDVVGGERQARAAGALVGRFHRALDGIEHRFAGVRLDVHDTPKHLSRLREAVSSHPDHRLAASVRALGTEILDAAARLPALPTVRPRVCHGDLKFNNLIFLGGAPPDSETAVCLIDLDTVGPMSLAFELGDAWRSWCNRAGEDSADAALDLTVLGASLDGYREGLGRALDDGERRALLLGVEWVSLELAARFAADAVFESYFGWNALRFPARGEHNLLRARGQWSLHQALAASRPVRAEMLGLDLRR